MEYARKMVLVPHENFERINQQGGAATNINPQSMQLIAEKSVQTPGDIASRLDTEMWNILKSSTGKNASEKWKLYQDVLRRYLFFTGKKEELEKEEESSQTHTQSNPYNIDAIVSAVPNKFRKQANSLLKHIQESADGHRLQWDATGNVKVDGVSIPGSNIVDLVNDSLRHRQTIKATGRELFAEFLRQINTPREFVGNKSFWTIRASPATSTPIQTNQSLSPNSYYTPNSTRRRSVRPTRKNKSTNDDSLFESTITSWAQLS